ncbi:MAG TPA: TadE/TadG family type IV pilus assembly protein [Ktedonobacterales bacterium]
MIQQQPGIYEAPVPSHTRHMRRLVAVENARRSSRKPHRASRGQTLIIFVLTFTVLIGFMGLALDAVRMYDLYARMQRAAEAGALAGVIYMPTNYTANLTNPPGDNAVCRAWQEAYKNSFGPGCTNAGSIGTNYCPTPATATEVAVCDVPGHQHELSVTITEPINALFLSALSVGPLTLSVTATAQYLPPVQIASDPSGAGGTGSWGTFGECGNSGTSASAACTGSGSRNWSGNINGPGDLKEMGDPLVTCEEGPSTGVADLPAPPTTPYYTYNNVPTNHPQKGSLPPGTDPKAANCTNPDTSNVFTGATTSASVERPGYAFYVNLEGLPSTQSASVWIWNAPFNPVKPQSCNGRQSTGQTSYDIFYEYNCSGSTSTPYPNYYGTNCSGQDPYSCALTDPRMLFNVTYSVYKIDLANPTDNSNLVGSFEAYPLMPKGNCGAGSYTLPSTNGGPSTCVTSACVTNWCPLGTPTNAGGVNSTATSLWNPAQLQGGNNYRIMVTSSDYVDPTNGYLGWGGHSFSLKLCSGTGIDQTNVQTCATPQNGSQYASIGGWNLSDALFSFPGNGKGNGGSQTTEYPLGTIPTSYNGRTLDISLYDPGDLLGSTNGVSIYGVAPPIAGVTDPCLETSSQIKAAGYDPTINGANFYFPNSERTALYNNNIPAMQPSNKNDLIYNGLWVDEQITLPSTYTQGAWTLCAVAPQTNDSDVLGIRVLALGQSPVHLIG